MMKHTSRSTLFCTLGLLLLGTGLASAVEIVKISNYGGGHQLWFEVEDFDERNPADENSFALSDAPGAFGRSINSNNGNDGSGYIRYTFDISKTGGAGGTWYFWGRVINPNNNSDFMLVDGNPGDQVPFTLPVTGLVNGQRIFEQSGLANDWVWSPGPGEAGEEAHTKQLRDGENTMYIISREAGATWDVFMWTDDPGYVPTDADYENAEFASDAKAADPSPASGATDVPYYANVLSWGPGEFAATHDVYFSKVFADVNDGSPAALVSAGQAGTTVAVETELETTYYWRVDEVNGAPDFTVYPGQVWSFTVEPVTLQVQGVTATASSEFSAQSVAANAANGSGLTDGLHGVADGTMWLSASNSLPAWIEFDLGAPYKLTSMSVWNQNQPIESVVGFGAKDVVVETSLDGAVWSVVEDVNQFAQSAGLADAPVSTIVDLGGIMAMYARITINAAYGPVAQSGLSEVQFNYIPVAAREPLPVQGDTLDSFDVVLSWRGGRDATSHEVLFSDNSADVEDGSAVITATAEDDRRLDLAGQGLRYGGTYYWAVNEIADDGSVAHGPLWSFAMTTTGVIDDMELYADEEGKEIWNTWVDGYDDPDNNGGLVGTGPGDTEGDRANFFDGAQSLPLRYDTTTAPIAAVTRTFDPALDLTVGGPETIGIYFKGDAAELNGFYSTDGNTWTDMSFNPQKVQMSGDMLIGLAVTSHAGVTPATAVFSNVSTTGDVTGDWTQADIGGTQPPGLFTEVNGTITVMGAGADIWTQNDEFRFVYKMLHGDGSITARVDSLETANDWTKGGVMIRDSDATNASMGIVCATGIMGTRYQARLATDVAAISDTDVLDGIQQITEEPVWVRIERKSVNAGAGVYMVVTDSAGKSAKVSHPDPAATLLTDWTLFSIAIDDLSGLNVSSIRSITMGVEGGNATGTIFADTLHVSGGNQ